MMTKKVLKSRYGRAERGQSLVEFVLVLPVFLLFLFAIIDFGMGFHAWITVTNASREGARIGAVGATSAEIENKVRSSASSLDQNKLSVAVTNAQGAPGDPVTVDVSYRYDLITPLSNILNLVGGGGIGSSLTFTANTEMRLE